MADSPLLTKSKAFVLEIIHVCNDIKRSQKESILTNQLVRYPSGDITYSWMNYPNDIIAFVIALSETE